MNNNHNLYKTVGELIRTARVGMGMTQNELASKIDVTAATISLYESGDRKPELEKIKIIAKVLNTSEAFLMGSVVDSADINLALRSEKLSPSEITQVKEYIKLVKRAKENG